jgi:hypothetical protein
MTDTISCASVGLTDEFDYGQDFPSTDAAALKTLAEKIHTAHVQSRELKLLYGGAKGIFIQVSSRGVEIRIPTVVWHGPHDPEPSLTLWKSLRWEKVDEFGLVKLLAQASEARRQEFRRCRFCGREVAPEHRHDDRTCHGCAERHLGVVH